MAEIDQLMTDRARAQMGKSIHEDAEIEDVFGLYYPLWYAFDTWAEHNDHGLYPRAGGYDEQDWQLMQDWKTLDRRYGKAFREQGGGVNGDAMSSLQKQYGSGKNWMEL